MTEAQGSPEASVMTEAMRIAIPVAIGLTIGRAMSLSIAQAH